MTEGEVFLMREKIAAEVERQGWKCYVCGKPLGTDLQWAHRLPQNAGNLAKYGKEVVHHRLNGVVVCSLECNQAVSVRNEVLWEAQLVAIIRAAIKEEGRP